MSWVRLDKHHGFGNDFLVTFGTDVVDDDRPAFARAACDRRRGVGADGVLFGAPVDGADASMVLYNADGSRAEMSGNGIRCFAQALARRDGRALPAVVSISTDVGLRTVELGATDDPHSVVATVGMGNVSEIGPPPGWAAVGADRGRPVAHLSVGNPHTVVAVDDVTGIDLLALGSKVPGVNLEIVHAGPGPAAITMRVHERGAGITEACGTGACAAAVAARRWGLATPVDGKIVVHMDGGSASVAFEATDGEGTGASVSLSGPATYIATIDYPRND